MASLFEQSKFSKLKSMINGLRKQPWSEHSTYCLCMTLQYWLKSPATLEEYAIVFENHDSPSLFYKGTDEVNSLSTTTPSTSNNTMSMMQFSIEASS